MILPKNKYTKILLRTIKDLNLTHYLDSNQICESCLREGIDNNAMNSINAIILMPDMILSLETPESKFIAIETEYFNRIRKDVIDNLCNIVEKSFKNYHYNNINTPTIDFRLRFNTARKKIISKLKDYINPLYYLSTPQFYTKIFRDCDITPDGYDPILKKIIKEIKNGTIE